MIKFKKYKNRKFHARLDERYTLDDMVVLHHKGLEYLPGVVKRIKKLGRRKIMVKAYIEQFGHTVERPSHQFIKVRKDKLWEHCLRPLDRLARWIQKRFKR